MVSGTAVTFLLTYRYWILFPLAIIEGPVIAMVCGYLAHLGLFDIAPLFATLFLADMTGDIGWYWIGRLWGHGFLARFGRYVSLTESHVTITKRVFQRYHTPILLVSKVTMGLGFPGAVLFTAGLSRIPFGRYLALNAIGQVVWTGMLLSIGYFLSHFAEALQGALGTISSVALMVLALGILFGIARAVRRAITKRFA